MLNTKQLDNSVQDYCEKEKDPFFVSEIESVQAASNYDELYDRFYTSLQFGTAGLRGIIGGGLNRMNPYIVRGVTQGLAAYLIDQFTTNVNSIDNQPAISVAIAYDTRNFSKVFAESAAEVLCGNGIKTYLYEDVRPVPMLSYAVRKLNTTAGIVITASHNPPEYNGYKVYWGDGAQIVEPHDRLIAESIQTVFANGEIQSITLADAERDNVLAKLGTDFDSAYYTMVMDKLYHPELFKKQSLLDSHTIVYTPLHGSGAVPVKTICELLGISIQVVEEQELPDGDFPTVKLPNPEDPDAMKLAVELGKAVSASCIIGTDPDADRLGLAVPDSDMESGYRLLTGNQIAVLLGDYIIRQNAAESMEADNSSQNEKPAIFCLKSIVTTDLLRRIALENHMDCFDTLTGFKFIAEQIENRETDGSARFIFGAEESFGYLTNNQVRDKDAVSTAVMVIEMMLWYADNGKDLISGLHDIWEHYGYYNEQVFSRTLSGVAGLQKIASVMDQLRSNPPVGFSGITIADTIDLEDTGSGLPPANVVIFTLEDESKVIVRPSGTEPKIKFYIHTRSDEAERSQAAKECSAKTDAILSDLDAYL